jgi:endogenous inhibitor of DNA gyrase (YacG/DUF329 family)
MTDLGAWATERYRIPGSTLTMDTSLPDLLEEDDDTATQQHS